MIKIKMTLPTVPFGNVKLGMDEADLVRAKEIADKALALYALIDSGPEGAQEDAVKAIVEGLGATVLETTTNPVVPGPEAAVATAWERPADPASTPAPVPEAPVNTNVNWEGF